MKTSPYAEPGRVERWTSPYLDVQVGGQREEGRMRWSGPRHGKSLPAGPSPTEQEFPSWPSGAVPASHTDQGGRGHLLCSYSTRSGHTEEEALPKSWPVGVSRTRARSGSGEILCFRDPSPPPCRCGDAPSQGSFVGSLAAKGCPGISRTGRTEPRSQAAGRNLLSAVLCLPSASV